MLPDRWYPILFSRSLQSRPLPVRRGGLDLVLFRGEGGAPRCLLDRCPHRGVPLSLGAVREGRIVCGYHGFEFDGGGECVHMPCEGSGRRIPAGMTTPRFPVRERDGILWLFWGAEARADARPIPALAAAEGFGGSAYDSTLEWPLHYANSLENNFDIHHFQFVHTSASWLQRPGSLVREVEVTRLEDGLHYRAEVEPAPGERGRPTTFRVEYRAPSLQSIQLADHTLVTVYDAPVDATTTHRMLRMYVRAPGLAVIEPLAARLFSLFAGRYAQIAEDLPFARRVVPPGHDRLVRADAGIAAFRKFRRDALRAAVADELPAHVRAAIAWDGLIDTAAAPE